MYSTYYVKVLHYIMIVLFKYRDLIEAMCATKIAALKHHPTLGTSYAKKNHLYEMREINVLLGIKTMCTV